VVFGVAGVTAENPCVESVRVVSRDAGCGDRRVGAIEIRISGTGWPLPPDAEMLDAETLDTETLDTETLDTETLGKALKMWSWT